MADAAESPRPGAVAFATRTAGLVWCGVLLLTIVLTGCPRFGLFYAIFVALTLVILAAMLLFALLVPRRGTSKLFPALKKLTGYAIVLHYVAHALPRVEWEAAGLITDGRAIFLYALTLACTLSGIVFYILIRRDPAFPRVDRRTAKAAPRRRRGVIATALDWVDALASAVIAVLLIQTFVFQLYQVPSESMVPVFLSGDRPFTLKVDAGPRLPLTEWRLPFLKQPARGDVVTIANPRYPENSGVNLRKYLSQMVYMVTFTLVNIDRTAADGSPKADPLVKRIVGVPGEKLMMVDDVLYARTAADPDFRPVAADRDRYAQIDLWKLPPGVQARVRDMRSSQQIRAMLSRWDAVKNGSDPTSLAESAKVRWDRLSAAVAQVPAGALQAFERQELPRANPAIATLREQALAFRPAGSRNPISLMGAGAEDLSLALAVCRSASALATVKEYALAGLAASAGPTAYERGSHALNLTVKANLLDRMERDIALVRSRATLEELLSDGQRSQLVQEAKELDVYLEAYYDARNFPEFPSGSAYLGAEQYFAMGDNRYNSLDFRFADSYAPRALDPSDKCSVVYPSALAPFPLERRYIEGYAVFRVWPLNRLGIIR